MKYYFLLFVFTLNTGCTTSKSVDSQLENNYKIIETVARFHFAKERYASELAYLSIFGEDPPSPFIERFNDLHIEVLPGSKHEISKRPYLFEILKINTESESTIVEAQDYYDGFFSISYHFRLNLRNKNWVIQDSYIVEL